MLPLLEFVIVGIGSLAESDFDAAVLLIGIEGGAFALSLGGDLARLHASALKQCADRGSTLLGKLLIHFRRPRRIGIAVYGHVQIRKIDELINVLLKRLFGRRVVSEIACAECKRESGVALVELELIADEDRLAVFVEREYVAWLPP